MSFNHSAEYQLEQAILPIFSSVSNLNIYTTNRVGAKLFPYVTISARPSRQLIDPYSGVYEIDVSIDYSQTSAKYSESQFDEQYLNVFSELYSPDLPLNAKIQENATDIKIYMARISSQSPTIEIAKRAWRKGLVLTAFVTYDQTPIQDAYSYQFDDSKNSMYLATI